jgi:hypothetical protein
MGITDETGKAVSGYISALGTQPVLLVQSLIIAAVVFILYTQGSKSFSEREQLLKSVFTSQQEVREILTKCIVPPDRRTENDDNFVPLPRPRPPDLGGSAM